MSQQASFRIPLLPTPVRIGLSAWERLVRAGLPAPSLEESSLIAAARRRTGLEHFGDAEFRLPMRKLLYSLEYEAQLHPLGRAVLRSSLIRTLGCRLRLEHAADLHPDLGETRVREPIFIAGLQRTGTTMLHRLLGLDPGLRTMAAWEALNPAPLSGTGRAGPEETRARIAEAVRAEKGMRYMSPALFAIHPIEAESPEEDVFLLDVTYISGAVDASLHVPSYTEWIREAPQEEAYRYLARLIQLLLWQRPGRYLGKTPHHLENLDALFEAFPDAKVIHTHRDPQRVVPSFASMMAHAGSLLSSRRDLQAVGQRVFEQTSRSVERSMEMRAAARPGAVLDVHYAELMREPLREMRRIHDFLELEFDRAAEQRVESWLASNPKNKNGAHRYRCEDFGLAPEALDARFKRYREHFGVEEESS